MLFLFSHFLSLHSSSLSYERFTFSADTKLPFIYFFCAWRTGGCISEVGGLAGLDHWRRCVSGHGLRNGGKTRKHAVVELHPLSVN